MVYFVPESDKSPVDNFETLNWFCGLYNKLKYIPHRSSDDMSYRGGLMSSDMIKADTRSRYVSKSSSLYYWLDAVFLIFWLSMLMYHMQNVSQLF